MKRATLAALVLWATLSPCHADPLEQSVIWTLNKVRPWWNDQFAEHRWDLTDLQGEYKRTDDFNPLHLGYTATGPDTLYDMTALATVREPAGDFIFETSIPKVSPGPSWAMRMQRLPGETMPPPAPEAAETRGRTRAVKPQPPPLDVAVCVGAFNGYLKKRHYMLMLFKMKPTADPNVYTLDQSDYVQKVVASENDRRCVR